jgi:acyl carrier protein
MTLPPDRYESETIEIARRFVRGTVEMKPESELLADLGFDSLQVVEFIGELEERFKISVPLEALSQIRTLAQVVAEVRRLATEQQCAP